MNCFICGADKNLDMHHIFGGSRRDLSTKYGLVVPLCHVGCHNFGRDSIHDGYTQLAHDRRTMLHQYGQLKAMHDFGLTVEEFRKLFGRSYL